MPVTVLAYPYNPLLHIVMRIIIICSTIRKPPEYPDFRRNMDTNCKALSSLRRGQKGVIAAVDPTDPQVQRLMVLGLVEGAEVELAGAALGGDPMEFRLFGSGISLRQEQARHFTVSSPEFGD